MAQGDDPLEGLLDAETFEAWRVLSNSVRTPDSVFDRAAKAIERLAYEKRALLELTAALPFHPAGYEGECWCSVCQVAASYDPDG